MEIRILPQNYITLPDVIPQATGYRKLANRIRGAILSPLFWLTAHHYQTPGLDIHFASAKLGLRLLLSPKAAVQRGWGYQFMFWPMDSTRYFEFDFAWQSLHDLPANSQWLDVSSPRLLLLLALDKNPSSHVELINPDAEDLAVTDTLRNALGIQSHCNLSSILIESVPFLPQSFDVISSISVVEHIPEDTAAVKKMWSLLKPGGRLLLSMPCAMKASEQYINKNQYGVLSPGEDGFVFFQRFYDKELLHDHIFRVTGTPQRMQLYGERNVGRLQENAAFKRKEWQNSYPFWREPFMMGQEYSYFDSIDQLPGEGVIAMEFIKQ